MDNIVNLLNEINFRKKGISLVMDNQNVTTQDIMDVFNNLSSEVQNLGVQNFRLDAYNVVFGDNVLKIQYTKDDKVYYMMMATDRINNTVPNQIAVGASEDNKVYMMIESFPDANTIDLMAFSKFAINQKVRGLSLGIYRDTMRLFGANYTFINDESVKCLELGFEAMDAFCSLINEVKSKDKRKKLSI